ncbi:MAG: hypothetical protein Ct9H300mP19_08920 [Dehalococcoidia bacterium]|nr:MAG: hypothetical protein Ct9H300mP19_08920 [Dehalococcoidia bacterium]
MAPQISECFGADTFAAIIVPPNAGIIAVGAVKEKPIVDNGNLWWGKQRMLLFLLITAWAMGQRLPFS